MRFLLRAVTVFAAILAVALSLFFAVGPETAWQKLTGAPDLGRYDFEALARHDTANDALACSPDLCGTEADFDLPTHEAGPADLIRQLNEAILASADSVRRVDDGTDPAYARYVTHSPIMGYPDTTDIEAVDLGNGRTGLRAYARAKLGQRDFGANAQRLRDWLQ